MIQDNRTFSGEQVYKKASTSNDEWNQAEQDLIREGELKLQYCHIIL